MEINEEVIKQLAQPYKQKIIIGSIIIAAILLAIITFTIGRYHPDSSIVEQLVNQQLVDAKEKYQKDMSDKDKIIADLTRQKADSDKRLVELNKKNSKTDQKIANIKAPKTMKEAKERIGRAGYVVK